MRFVNHDWPTFLAVTWVVFWLLVVAGLGLGWVLNIVALAHMQIPPFTGLLILRVVGIFIPPIGGIVGYV